MFRIPMFLWDKDVSGGTSAEDDEDPNQDVTDENHDDADEEFENEFAKMLSEKHPELLDAYRDNTKGLLSALRNERDTNKSNKSELKELVTLRKEKEDRDREQRTELENAQHDVAEWQERAEKAESQVAYLKKESIILAAASKLDYNDPQDAIRFMDDFDDLEVSDDGKTIVDLDKKLKAQIAEHKYLVKSKDLGPGTDDSDTSKRKKLDDDPKTKRKVKEGQPKLAV